MISINFQARFLALKQGLPAISSSNSMSYREASSADPWMRGGRFVITAGVRDLAAAFVSFQVASRSVSADVFILDRRGPRRGCSEAHTHGCWRAASTRLVNYGVQQHPLPGPRNHRLPRILMDPPGAPCRCRPPLPAPPNQRSVPQLLLYHYSSSDSLIDHTA